jgi:phage shock protein E
MNWLSHLFPSSATDQGVTWNEDALLVDVRTPAEFSQGHVEGALNLPLDQFAQKYQQLMPDRARQVVVYCRSGARSHQAMQFLQQQNYVNVINGETVQRVATQTNRAIA